MAQGEGGILSEATNTEYTWTLLRMTPAHLLTTGIEVQEEQPVPSWGGFNIIFWTSFCYHFGYCPMIEGSSTEFSTVYTVMKPAQKVY